MHISRKEFGDPTSKFNHIYFISYRDYVKFIITLTTLCSCLQLVTEVKQKRKDDLLFSCCSKCNTLLVKTLKPHLDFRRCISSCPTVKLRWLATGFVGALLIVCYQLSASFDQQLLTYNLEFLQHQV